MDFNNGKKIFDSFKRQPLKTTLIIILLLILLALSTYVAGFFGEKAKEHATTVKSNGKGEQVNQTTKGDKSPAVVSDGDVKIEYGGDK
jgi:hypothetical protein